MPITGSATETGLEKREIVASHTDCRQLFLDLDIDVDDEDQPFTIILRRDGKDIVVGEVNTSNSLVLQFLLSTGPTEI